MFFSAASGAVGSARMASDFGKEAVAMAASDSFNDVMARLRAGDEAAVREIFQRFVGKLIHLARGQFDAALRRKVDPEDVVQSAYKSFFLRYGAGKLEVENWGNLWGLLTMITLRKCLDQVEYHQAGCRDVKREAAAQADPAAAPWWQAVAREPTPQEAAILVETVEQLLRGLDEKERPILELSLQGYTGQEISEQLGYADRSVRRFRERVRKRLERMQLADM
jgi:RNA polymerase sigma-70 factor (ECF subfamily)